MKKIILGTLFSLGAISLMASNGAQLAQKCKACHGVNFNKSALGHSDDISRFSQRELISELKEYKNENENDKYFQTMKAQVKNLSINDINAIAKYIAKDRKKQ